MFSTSECPPQEIAVLKADIPQTVATLFILPDVEIDLDVFISEENSISAFVHGTAVVKVHDRGVEERNKGQPN